MLGKREPGIYGSATLEDIDASLRNVGDELGADVDTLQSNLEGELLSAIQEAPSRRVDGILINPGAYGHTSIALRDALLSANLPFVEVHISNTYAREEYRHRSYISDISSGIIIGFGPIGYLHALRALIQLLNVKHVATQSEAETASGD
jgi:3-dehydroquinate dehydratase II